MHEFLNVMVAQYRVYVTYLHVCPTDYQSETRYI